MTLDSGQVYNYNYDAQTSKLAHETKLLFRDVAKGDSIKIKTTCNIFGSKTITIVAGQTPKTEKK